MEMCLSTAKLVALLMSVGTSGVYTSDTQIVAQVTDGPYMVFERSWYTNYYWCRTFGTAA